MDIHSQNFNNSSYLQELLGSTLASIVESHPFATPWLLKVEDELTSGDGNLSERELESKGFQLSHRQISIHRSQFTDQEMAKNI